MKCDEFFDKANEYLDGELTDIDAQAMFEHMQKCDECRALFEELSNTKNALSSLPELEMPDSVALGTAYKVMADKRKKRKKFISALSGVAAALVVICMAMLYMDSNEDSEKFAADGTHLYTAEARGNFNELSDMIPNSSFETSAYEDKVLYVPGEFIAEMGDEVYVTENNISDIYLALKDYGVDIQIKCGEHLIFKSQ